MSECIKCGEAVCHCWYKKIPSHEDLWRKEIDEAIASADPNDIKITQAYLSLLDLINSGAEWEEGLFDAYDVVLRSQRNKREKQRTMHYVFGTNSICLIDEYGRVVEFQLSLLELTKEADVPGLKEHFKFGAYSAPTDEEADALAAKLSVGVKPEKYCHWTEDYLNVDDPFYVPPRNSCPRVNPIPLRDVPSYNSIQDIFAAAKEQESFPVLDIETGRLGIG